MMNFFLLVKSEESPIQRLSVAQKLQKELTIIFSDQQNSLFPKAREVVKFHPGFNCDDEELFIIEKFNLPIEISNAIADPTTVGAFEFGTGDLPQIKGIIASDNNNNTILFQSFDKRRVLSKKSVSLILSGKTFRRLEEPGITLDSKVVVLFKNNNIYFESYFEASRVLDLSDYYKEATDDDLRVFCAMDSLAVANPDHVKANADSWIRRRIAAVMESGVLEQESPKKIQQKAKEFKIALSISKNNGQEKIQLPEERKELKALLKFLLEDYSYGILSGKKYISSSKMPLR